jgi:hypothetical protein
VNGIPVTPAELRVIDDRPHPLNHAEITETDDVPEPRLRQDQIDLPL